MSKSAEYAALWLEALGSMIADIGNLGDVHVPVTLV